MHGPASEGWGGTWVQGRRKTFPTLLVVPVVHRLAVRRGSRGRVVLLEQRAAQVAANDLVRDAAQHRVLEQRMLDGHLRALVGS